MLTRFCETLEKQLSYQKTLLLSKISKEVGEYQPIRIEEHSIKMWIHRKAPSKTFLTHVLSTSYLEQEKFRIIYDIN